MNKKPILYIFCLLIILSTQAQNKKSKEVKTIEEWRDIEVFEQHKLYPHANVIPYAKEKDIESSKYTASPYYVSLNGAWHFHLAQHANSRPDIVTKGFSGKEWPSVSIPDGKWQTGNKTISTAVIKKTTDIPESSAVGTYFREYFVPKNWAGYSVYLQLRTASACYIWINQQYVGYSEDSRDYSEFDVSKYLKVGKTNQIVIQVYGTCDGSLLEMGNAKDFNGITGDVFFVLKNDVNVRDYNILAEYNQPTKTGIINLEIDVLNPKKKGQYYLEVELWTPQGKVLEKMGKWVVFDKKSEVSAKLNRELVGVKPWSAEIPTLYTAVIRLRDKDMTPLETVGTRFGFRSIEMKDGKMLVNNVPITLRGMNYAAYHPTTGNPTHEQMRLDLQRMKRNNINAVHTTYYSPCDPYFYELCDEFGFYVFCDANLMPFSDRSKAIATDVDYADLFTVRVQNMYERYKNHPSIIAWSLGRSTDNGACMENAYRTLRQKDMMRPVVFTGAAYADNTDLIFSSNLTADDLKVFAAKKQGRPLVLSSFGSTQGNNFGGLETLWSNIRRQEKLQGGFADNWSTIRYFDQVTGKEKRLGGFIDASNEPLPYLSELKSLYRPFNVELIRYGQDAGEFSVTNWTDFLSLDDYILEYNIFSNLKPRIIEGEVSVDLKPGESKNFKLKVPKLTLYAGEILFIRFTIRQRVETSAVPQGSELGTMEFPIPMREVQKIAMPDYGREPLTVQVENQQTSNSQYDNLTITGSSFSICYNLTQAELSSCQLEKTEMLASAPQLCTWRVPTDNDNVDKNGYRLWQNLSPDKIRREVVATNYQVLDPYTVSIDAMLRYTDIQGNVLYDVKQSIAILHSGDILIDNEIVSSEHIKAMPKIGLQVELPRTMDSIKWFGLNNENYSDRYQSGVMGTYKEAVDQMTYTYERPQESGNRMFTQWLATTDGTHGLFVDMLDSTFNFSIAPYSDKQRGSVSDASQLKPSNVNTLHIDYKQAGIGSATAGIGLAEENMITQNKFRFRVHLRAYNVNEYNPQDFRRILYPTVESSVLPMPILNKSKERFDGPMQITMSSVNKAEIRFTTDGTTPTQTSALYKKPITIESSTIVKARAFKKGATPSFTTTHRYNFDYITSATFVHNANTPYNFNMETMLFDGETGDVTDLSRGWLGFSGNDLSVVFMLSKEIELQNVEMNFAHVPDAWAFAPSDVYVCVSSDGVTYSNPIHAKIKYDPSSEEMNAAQLQHISIDVEKDHVRYVRIVAKNIGKIPSWHKAKGLRPWIMVDEVHLNEIIH